MRGGSFTEEIPNKWDSIQDMQQQTFDYFTACSLLKSERSVFVEIESRKRNCFTAAEPFLDVLRGAAALAWALRGEQVL